jgi:hypothetical protein
METRKCNSCSGSFLEFVLGVHSFDDGESFGHDFIAKHHGGSASAAGRAPASTCRGQSPDVDVNIYLPEDIPLGHHRLRVIGLGFLLGLVS